MTNVLCFKPGVADSRTAFEAMAPIYRFLEKNYEYEFTIVTADSDTYDDNELQVISIPKSGTRNAIWKATQYITNFPTSIGLSSKIDNYFEKADIVITVDPTSRPAGIVGIKKAVSTNTPVWFDAGRTTVRPFEGSIWRLRRRVFSKAVRETTGIIVTSPKVFEYFSDINLFDEEIAEKFTVLGHPTDTTEFVPGDFNNNEVNTDIEIIAIARLVPEKGLYYILEALDPVLTKRDKVHLTIIGEGPMDSILKRELRNRGLSDSVDLKGTVPHTQIPTLLQSADIFVNHSVDVAGWEEFFGAANIEAMSCGLPCVLSDSGSIPYVARVPDGVKLVAQRDVVDLRENIEELIENPSKRTKMGRRARKFVKQNYSIEAIGEKYHQMLQRGLET